MKTLDLISTIPTLIVSLSLFFLSIILLMEKQKTSLIPLGIIFLNVGIDYFLESKEKTILSIIPDIIISCYAILIARFELKIRAIIKRHDNTSSATNSIISE